MSSDNELEYSELLGFLQDQKPEVQRFAAEGVLSQTENLDFIEYCRRKPRAAARPLLRLAEKAEADAAARATVEKGSAPSSAASDKKASRKAELDTLNTMGGGEAALQALVNLSSLPAVQAELVALNAPKRITEAMRAGWLEGRADTAHWHSMLLANITSGKVGQDALCEEEALLCFLLAAFLAKPRPPPRDGYDDPLLCLGKVICNTLVQPKGRRLLVGGERGSVTLGSLISELGDRGRRPDVIKAIQNICLDNDYHVTVASTDLTARLGTFLYPFEKVEEEHRKNLPDAVREMLQAEGATMTGDAGVRASAAMIFMCLIRTLEGREYLRALGSSELLRAWHLEETDEAIRSNIEIVLPAVQLSEDELSAEVKNQDSSAR